MKKCSNQTKAQSINLMKYTLYLPFKQIQKQEPKRHNKNSSVCMCELYQIQFHVIPVDQSVVELATACVTDIDSQ